MRVGKVGDKIAKLREERGYSQTQFSEVIHVSQPTLSRWENGYSMPSLDTLEYICANLGVNLEDLFEGDSAEYNALKKKLTRARLAFIGFLFAVLVFITILAIPKYRVVSEHSNFTEGIEKTVVVKAVLIYTENSARKYCERLSHKYPDAGPQIEIIVVSDMDYLENDDSILYEYTAYLNTEHSIK